MVKNDLVVEPMSLSSAFSLLNRVKTPPSNLTEKVVFIGVKEVSRVLCMPCTFISA